MIDPWVWLFLVSVLCKQHNLPPAEALGVAHIESRIGSKEFRFGPMTRRFSGPMGIARCFPGADDPCMNTVLGVEALARLKRKKGSLKGALRVYNSEFTGSYWAAVREAIQKYRGVE